MSFLSVVFLYLAFPLYFAGCINRTKRLRANSWELFIIKAGFGIIRYDIVKRENVGFSS